MKSLFNTRDTEEIISRINKLTPESQHQWGKMDVAQMMAHCSILLRIARGLDTPPRRWIGRVIGWMFKEQFFGDKPLPKNSPTDKSFKVVDTRQFETEKTILIEHIKAFSTGGADACTRHPNPFFGALSPEEWARGQYKHLDHHLQQFGV